MSHVRLRTWNNTVIHSSNKNRGTDVTRLRHKPGLKAGFSWWNELCFVFRSLTVPYRARGSGRQRATTRRRRTCASSCLTSGLRPTRWSLWSIWYHACVTISTATSTRTSNPCSRGTSSRRCQVYSTHTHAHLIHVVYGFYSRKILTTCIYNCKGKEK